MMLIPQNHQPAISDAYTESAISDAHTTESAISDAHYDDEHKPLRALTSYNTLGMSHTCYGYV